MTFDQILTYAKAFESMIGDARIMSDDNGVIEFDNGHVYYYSVFDRMVGSK